MPEVKRKKTDYAELGREARYLALYYALVQAGISERAAPMFVAHLLLEHGRELGGLWNNSLGNVKWWKANADAHPDVKYFYLEDRALDVDMYRAFDNLDEAAPHYAYEAAQRRPGLVAAAEAGDPLAFASELLDSGYVGKQWPPHAGVYASEAEQRRDLAGSMLALHREVIAEVGTW